MGITDTLEDIRSELELFENDLDKYDYIIELGKQLEGLDQEFKSDAYKVQGCVSNVWINYHVEEGRIVFEADSDAQIVRGLVQILLMLFSKRTSQEILKFEMEDLSQLGLQEIITPGRQNGLASMIKRILQIAQSAE